MHYFSIILACLLIVALFIYFSEKTKNNFFKWAGRLFPPVLMLGLIKIPMDVVTSIIWLVAGIVMIYSFCKLVSLLIKLISCFIKKEELITKKQLGIYVRPFLCVLFFFTASHFVSKSVYSANAKALELALATQEYVQKNGACNTEKPEWATFNPLEPESIETQYGEYGTKYRLVYTCDIENKKFQYWVRINQDESFSVVGTFDGSIDVTFGHFGAPKTVSLSKNLDLEKLAKMKIKLIKG